jgi:RNA polymerase sigma-70 factor (ECF subfamily)
MLIQDSKLIPQLQQGKKEAYAQLFEMYFENLVRAAEFYLQDIELAEDVVMDVFAYFIENPEKFKEIENLKAYLYRLTKNRALNHIRHLGIRDKHEERIVEAMMFAELPEHDFQDKIKEVNKAIDELAPKTKEVFSACVIDGKSYKEVAEEYNISVNTVNTMIKRAYKSIRGKFDIGLALLISLLFH